MNMMHHMGCKCPHHVVAKVFHFLASVAGLGFFLVVLRKAALFGYSADAYFMAAIVLVIMAKGTSICGCCMRHWGMMKGAMGGGMCSHEGGCVCGDCDRCK